MSTLPPGCNYNIVIFVVDFVNPLSVVNLLMSILRMGTHKFSYLFNNISMQEIRNSFNFLGAADDTANGGSGQTVRHI